MKGSYIVKKNGDVVASVDNILTDAAQRVILRYLAGENRSWAGSIAVGASDDEPLVEDTHLGFEFGRGPVDVRSSDLLESSVVAKAKIPGEIEGLIYELGLFSSLSGGENESDQLLITDFDPDLPSVLNVTPSASRVGTSASLVQTSGDETVMAEFNDMTYNISVLGPEDRMILAYEASASLEIEVRLMNSPNDYVYYTFTCEPGYNIEEWGITELSQVGNGSVLSVFTGLHVLVTGSDGEESIILDGLRADDTDVFEEQVLVSKAVLDEPIQRTVGTDLEVEYSIKFDF